MAEQAKVEDTNLAINDNEAVNMVEATATTKDFSKKKTQNKRLLRCSAILPFICSLVAFVLVIIIVISGSKPGDFQGYDMMALNTSSLGQNIIEFTPTTTTAEIAQGAKAAQNLTFSDTPVANTTTDLATRTNDPLAPLESWFAGLFNNATATVDGGLSSAEASLIKELLDSIGLQDYYALHLLNTCSGSLSGTHDSDFTANKCVSYSDETGGLRNITNSIPSSFTVLTTNVSVPILADLSSVIGYLSTTISGLSKTVFAFYIIAIIGAGITFLLSLLGIFIANSRPILYINMFFSLLSATFLLAGSIGVTIMVSIVSAVINSVGKSIGLGADVGSKFLTLTWVSWGLMALGSGYWCLVWFVEYRTWGFKIRRRTGAEVGDYRGIRGEMRRAMKAD